MGNIGGGLRGPRRWRAGVLTLAVLGLLVGPGHSTAAAEKRVACQLPFVSGAPNFFCSDIHQILFFADGYDVNNPGTTITAELLAMDEQGNVLQSIPVHAGDYVWMTSNTSLTPKISQTNNFFTDLAPIPVLHVTADDGVTKSEAFCSNVPFAQTIQPNNAVASLSTSDVTHVEVAIPLVDPSHLAFQIDGVDISLAVGPLASCTPASPCSGNLDGLLTNQCAPAGPKLPDVTISNLVVDSGAINQYAANTISFDVTGLGGGGHAFATCPVLPGQPPVCFPRPGSLSRFVSPQCHHGTSDTSFSSGFGITISQPTNQEPNVTFPVTVVGQVCSGRPIATLNINGLDVCDPNTTKCDPFETHTAGNGTTTADTYTLDFPQTGLSTALSQTDLAEDVAPGASVYQPTYDLGSNRVIAAASDDLGDRVFSAPIIFATGTTQNPGTPLAPIQQGIENALNQSLVSSAQKAAQNAAKGPTTDVANAFVIALDPASVQQQFTQRCTQTGPDGTPSVADQFATSAITNILAIPPKAGPTVSTPSCPGCDADTTITITGVQVPNPDQNIACKTTFDTGVIHVEMDLPDIIVTSHAGGSCGGSVAGITVDVNATTTISGITLKFDITQDQIQNQTTPPASATTFLSGSTNNQISGGVSTEGFCSILNFLVEVFTFGIVDLSPSFDITKDTTFAKEVGNSQPDPIGVKDMNVQQDTNKTYNSSLAGKLSTVTISPNGLVAGLKGSFGTLSVDPSVQPTPGAVQTGPPVPTMPLSCPTGATCDATALLSTDAVNMLLDSMIQGGALKTSCQDTGKTLGDLLPANCDTLTNSAGDSATVLERGVCHGIRGDTCKTLTASTPLLTAIEQGGCFGTEGANCSSIPAPSGSLANLVLAAAEKATCNATPNFNLHASQAIQVCTLQSLPTRLLPEGGGGNDPVHTTLRLRSLSAALILDRGGANPLDITDPKCFDKTTNRTDNCALYDTCLDINYNFDMSFITCTDGKPGFSPKFTSLQVFTRQAGLVCDGSGLAASDSGVLGQSASSDAVKTILPDNAQQNMPQLCSKGLDMSGFVSCTDPKLITIGTSGNPNFTDFIGVTCKITAP